MKKQIITLSLLAIAFTLSAQNTTEEDALYYIKKAYQHRNDTDKTTALQNLNAFEHYLTKNKLQPENVSDLISYYYANTISSLISSADKDTKVPKSINWETVYTYQIGQANKGNAEAQNMIGVYYYMEKKDSAKAVDWLTKASKKNNKLALENLINIYLFEKDFERATSLNLEFVNRHRVDYLFSLSEQGNRTATLFGAYYYLRNQSFNASRSRMYISKIIAVR